MAFRSDCPAAGERIFAITETGEGKNRRLTREGGRVLSEEKSAKKKQLQGIISTGARIRHLADETFQEESQKRG